MIDINHIKNRPWFSITEHTDFVLEFGRQGFARPAEHEVGQDPMRHQALKPSLRRFSFHLSVDFRDVRQHINNELIVGILLDHLPDALLLNHAFDVTDRPPDLYQTDVGFLLIHGDFILYFVARHITDPVFDTVGNVRDHLHRFA